MWRNRLGYDETHFLKSLPENLQTEVGLYLKKDVIEKVSLFKNSSESFKREVALLLKPIFLTPGDCIFKAGDLGDEMYFVVDGELNTLTQSEDKILTTLGAGDYFGENGLLEGEHQTVTIRAAEQSEVEVIKIECNTFKKILDEFQISRPEIAKVIQNRLQILDGLS
jgi:voltage-gated potassium channel